MNVRSDSHPSDEQQLVQLLRQRDRGVITFLYERYSAALYGVISNLIRDEAIAQETLQDVFLKIWHNADKYDASKGRLFTWMVQIARNAAIDTLRSAQFKHGDKTEALPTYVSNDSSLSEEQTTRDAGLRKVVQALDAQSRQIIELLYFQDYTQKEVGEALNMPLGTVKSRARKAISELRTILAKENLLMVGIISFIHILMQHFGR